MCVMIRSKNEASFDIPLSSIKMELCIEHIIFCGAIEERGPPYSVEENKGCGWKLPTGANCNISGASQGKKRRTTLLLIKRGEVLPDWTAGGRKKEGDTEQKKTKRGRQRDATDQWVECYPCLHIVCVWERERDVRVKVSSKWDFRD